MGSLLLESSVRGALLIAAVAMVLWALRIRTASVRHAAWASVLVGMLVLPALVKWGPQVSLALLPEQAASFGSAPVILETTGGDASRAANGFAVPVVVDSGARWSWQDYALGVYLLGLAFFLTRLTVGTLHVRRLLRSAELEQERLVHWACSTPITVGCFRPTVLLPRGWAQWPQAQLAAVLAHEAEHVRRRDPLFQWLGLFNRAVFWFHPLAWWLERRISALAEEVCDAGVLAQGHDPADYSRYLLAMARSAQESGVRVQALGMAMPGSGVEERVHNILDGARRTRASGMRLTCIAILIAGAGAVFSTGELVHAQAALPAFEVATIKPAEPGAIGMRVGMPSPGRIAMSNMTLLDMIRFAYGQGLAANLPISGGPDWMSRDHFNIEAQAPSTMASPNVDQLRVMLRALLAERFAVKLHTGTKEVDVYAMVLARGDRKLGPKLQLWDGNCNGRELPPAQPDSKVPRCSGLFSPTGLTVKGGSMAAIADMLSTPAVSLGRQVMDRTGLSGDYQLELEFRFTMPGPGGAPPLADALEGPSIFTALQEQLGLKLESARASVETLVIDSAEKPGEN